MHTVSFCCILSCLLCCRTCRPKSTACLCVCISLLNPVLLFVLIFSAELLSSTASSAFSRVPSQSLVFFSLLFLPSRALWGSSVLVWWHKTTDTSFLKNVWGSGHKENLLSPVGPKFTANQRLLDFLWVVKIHYLLKLVIFFFYFNDTER